jgi:hypothetical protein
VAWSLTIGRIAALRLTDQPATPGIAHFGEHASGRVRCVTGNDFAMLSAISDALTELFTLDKNKQQIPDMDFMGRIIQILLSVEISVANSFHHGGSSESPLS